MSGQLKLIVVRLCLATGRGAHRKPTSGPPAPPAQNRKAWMPPSCCLDDMNAAFMSYEN
jgi:hypothetical protein